MRVVARTPSSEVPYAWDVTTLSPLVTRTITARRWFSRFASRTIRSIDSALVSACAALAGSSSPIDTAPTATTRNARMVLLDSIARVNHT